MELTGVDEVDIKLDHEGQPVIDSDGDLSLISGDKCWLQDIRNEILTEQAELFYEDEDEDDSYGFGLTEFRNETYGEFLQLELEQRIKEKLKKREEIDPSSIRVEVSVVDGSMAINAHFKRVDEDTEYDASISEKRVEVVTE